MRPLRKGRYKSVAGENYRTPKEVWGFRTEPGRGTPRSIARAFLAANASLFELPDHRGAVAYRRIVHGLGASHVIFQQTHLGEPVHRAYVTVHVARDRRVYLAKNRAVPERLLPAEAEFRLTRAEAVLRARRAVRAVHGRLRHLGADRRWFFKAKPSRLLPAWRVIMHCRKPRREWIVLVNAKTGGVLSRYDNLAYATGRARVFDPSPVAALGDYRPLLSDLGNPRRPPPETYRTVRLRGLAGNGYLEGTRVTTRPTRGRVQRGDHRWELVSTERGFEEVMAYYHVDAAIRYLESLGYTGAKRIFREPVAIDVNGTREDNSWYSAATRELTFGTGDVDDAEDGETILHEFGHAVQDAIVPGFGQSLEAAAMGEGFADYFAASFFADRKPEALRPCVMLWDGILFDGDPPCVRRLDGDVTFARFRRWAGQEHFNGQIWSGALWEIRRALGRARADRVILDSHFQLDGFTTFARGARAIVDADANLYRGRHRRRLRAIFKRRGIGPV